MGKIFAPKRAVAAARIARCAALLALAMLVSAGPASAADSGDPYTVTVKVDATAGNAVDARHLARLNGQRNALEKLVEQLAGTTDVKLPKLGDNAITDMVDNFEVANEHMSTVRYLADYTFHFRAPPVRRLMHEAGIAPAGSAAAENPTTGAAPADEAATGAAAADNAAPDTPATGAVAGTAAGGVPTVVLPVFEDGSSTVLWQDPNPWREAWARRPEAASPGRLNVPIGDIGDLVAIDAPQALAGTPEALGAIATRHGGGDAVVALAKAVREGDRLAGLAVSIKRYRQGRPAGAQSTAFTINPGETADGFIARAVDGAAAAIASIANEGGGAPASLLATVPLSGLGDWVEVRDRLAAAAAVRRVDLLSLSRQEAQIEITYAGTPDQLKSSLADANLDLGGGDPAWRVRPAAAGRHP